MYISLDQRLTHMGFWRSGRVDLGHGLRDAPAPVGPTEPRGHVPSGIQRRHRRHQGHQVDAEGSAPLLGGENGHTGLRDRRREYPAAAAAAVAASKKSSLYSPSTEC